MNDILMLILFIFMLKYLTNKKLMFVLSLPPNKRLESKSKQQMYQANILLLIRQIKNVWVLSVCGSVSQILPLRPSILYIQNRKISNSGSISYDSLVFWS